MIEFSRYGLRTRLTLAMVLIVLGATSLFAVTFYFVNEELEMNVLSTLLQEELESFKNRYARGEIDTALFQSPTLSVYLEGGQLPPSGLRELPPGEYHDVHADGRNYHVLVEQVDGRKLWLSYDITHVETLAGILVVLLVCAVVLLSGLAAWASFGVARQLVGPVDQLASRVAALDPRQRSVRLAPDFQGKEVEVIARAFDRYMERLDGFVEREQSFTAAASHELRTPLAVIQGATELLAAQLEPDTQAGRAVDRIDRARGEMSEFIQALLLLAREEYDNPEFTQHTRLRPLIMALCEDFRLLLADRPVAIRTDCRADPVVDMPPALVTVIAGNLLRNAVEHTAKGEIVLHCVGDILSIRDTGTGMRAEQLAAASDAAGESSRRGLGLRLVRRICERYGWQLRISSSPGQGTTAVVTFRSV